MKKQASSSTPLLVLGIALLCVFALWTLLVRTVDVQAIGPQGSSVGFATVNQALHSLTGTNMTLYTVTDWLGLVPIAVVLSFGALGLGQWICRKSLWRVDRNLFVLGGFYLCVIAVFLLFEVAVINYRPILIEGVLEASYPSSTTMLVTTVMPTAMMQLSARIRHRALRRAVLIILAVFTVFMVVGRILSGVHWLTDIVGGLLVSAGLVSVYRALE